MRAGGMHLHLCLDGQESATEVHWADAGVHNDEEHVSQTHDDRDLNFGEVVGKTTKGFGDLPLAVLAAVLLLFLIPVSRERTSRREEVVVPLGPSFFLPPLRGPPL